MSVNIPQNSMFGLIKSLGNSAKDSAKNTAKVVTDVSIPNPKVDYIGTENQMNLYDAKIANIRCATFVSCDVGREIRNKLRDQKVAAITKYVEACKINMPSNDINQLISFDDTIKIKTAQINNAMSTYEKEIKMPIKIDRGLQCKIAVNNAVDTSGNSVFKVDGIITEINPKTDMIKIEATTYKKTSGGVFPIKINEYIKILDLCVGGTTVGSNATNTRCLERDSNGQLGGNGNPDKEQLGGIKKPKSKKGGYINKTQIITLSDDSICD